MMRRPSVRAGGSVANESSSSTMSATSRVTELPLRIATPTCALLQRAGVVDAVADHRDLVPCAAQRGDDPFLLLRGDAAEDAVGGDRLVEGRRSAAVLVEVGELADRRSPGASRPARRASAATVSRVVAGEDLHRDTLGGQAGRARR